jgi:hypothetical protein
MFTLEINGTALVVTNADEVSARALLESEEFKEDLKSFTSDGRALWDGKAPLTVRPATEDEIDSFDEALNDDEYEEEEEEEEEDDGAERKAANDDDDDDDEEPIDIVFLVEIDEQDDPASA